MDLSKLFIRGEIWMVDFNPTIGREQSGIRPALVVSDDNFNQGPAELVLVIPLTSKFKFNPLHVKVVPNEGGLKVESYIKIEDIRSVSKIRFVKKLGEIRSNTLTKVENNLSLLLKLS